jgi:aldose 1-epimerase
VDFQSGGDEVKGAGSDAAKHGASISCHPFWKTREGVAVGCHTLRNQRGMDARTATLGGIVKRLTAPDRNGHFADVVLGFDSLSGYINNRSYFGALIGRQGGSVASGDQTAR